MVLTDTPIVNAHGHADFAITLDPQKKLLLTYGFGLLEIMMNAFIWNMIASSDFISPMMLIGAIAAGMALLIVVLQGLMLSYDFFVQNGLAVTFTGDDGFTDYTIQNGSEYTFYSNK